MCEVMIEGQNLTAAGKRSFPEVDGKFRDPVRPPHSRRHIKESKKRRGYVPLRREDHSVQILRIQPGRTQAVINGL
jgi:hypothetical protein